MSEKLCATRSKGSPPSQKILDEVKNPAHNSNIQEVHREGMCLASLQSTGSQNSQITAACELQQGDDIVNIGNNNLSKPGSMAIVPVTTAPPNKSDSESHPIAGPVESARHQDTRTAKWREGVRRIGETALRRHGRVMGGAGTVRSGCPEVVQKARPPSEQGPPGGLARNCELTGSMHGWRPGCASGGDGRMSSKRECLQGGVSHGASEFRDGGMTRMRHGGMLGQQSGTMAGLLAPGLVQMGSRRVGRQCDTGWMSGGGDSRITSGQQDDQRVGMRECRRDNREATHYDDMRFGCQV
jgi:hypothetical protein